MLSSTELTSSGVEQNIGNAHRVVGRLGDHLRVDEQVAGHLARLGQRLAAVATAMQRIDLAGLCTTCAATTTSGGCCFAGMSGEADVTVLTINLLLGATVARQHQSAEECAYLGPSGCTLPCKPVFCLSFTCPRMVEHCSREELVALDIACAQVLREQMALEDRLRRLLASFGNTITRSR